MPKTLSRPSPAWWMLGALALALPAVALPAAAAPRLARGEPPRGCYFSVFVGPDPSVRTEMFARGGPLEEAVGRLAGKRVAIQWEYFTYWNWRELEGYLRVFASRRAVMEVALEPRGLDEVRDDGLLRTHARLMAAYRRPLFLRFASEMNGPWAPYHGNPSLYRQKFRLVHDVMEQLAPNVIMVWCVAHEPSGAIPAYYPGDAYVDWVGVNFYSVLHHNGDPRQPAGHESPAAKLDAVYHRFAARKPIAICEYAATHGEALDRGRDRSDWAAAKLTALLTALPRRYPRVKMVGLYNVNTMQRGFASRSARRNNYCFTDSPTVLRALRKALASKHYLSDVR